jgi:hypothetical protein
MRQKCNVKSETYKIRAIKRRNVTIIGEKEKNGNSFYCQKELTNEA